ncbi:hypothetical protein [Jatrophihabitans sp.]|jgi:hypothetical protein|uniref:hypothetical protein n=1 Tax=Jatrophihabitans sp. TaxID=1932789 RepID=UPI002F16519C
MTLCRVQAPDQRVKDNRNEAAPGNRLLSVAEVQQALRALRAREPSEAAPPLVPTELFIGAGQGGWPADASLVQPIDGLGRWVSVVAAHAGAGASTVALAIADAAAAVGRDAHLVETAYPARSGLVTAAHAELGLDPDGAWRRGSRGRVTIHRRADSDIPTGWPALLGSQDGLVVVDLGLPTPDSLTRFAASGCRTVVVCRPTVPGVRLAEQLLNAVTGPVIIASLGGGRWPGEVNASLGPWLRELHAENAVVTVPTDRRLEVTGLTSSPLPKPVAAAGRSLLALIDAAHSDTTASTQSAPRRKGTE